MHTVIKLQHINNILQKICNSHFQQIYGIQQTIFMSASCKNLKKMKKSLFFDSPCKTHVYQKYININVSHKWIVLVKRMCIKNI